MLLQDITLQHINDLPTAQLSFTRQEYSHQSTIVCLERIDRLYIHSPLAFATNSTKAQLTMCSFQRNLMRVHPVYFRAMSQRSCKMLANYLPLNWCNLHLLIKNFALKFVFCNSNLGLQTKPSSRLLHTYTRPRPNNRSRKKLPCFSKMHVDSKRSTRASSNLKHD